MSSGEREMRMATTLPMVQVYPGCDAICSMCLKNPALLYGMVGYICGPCARAAYQMVLEIEGGEKGL